MGLLVCVNRTPITGDIAPVHNKNEINLFGCGLEHTVAEAPKDKSFTIWLNITTPYMPITSDGKEDLEPFFDQIRSAVSAAVRKAHRPGAKGVTQKSVVLDNLDDAIAAQGLPLQRAAIPRAGRVWPQKVLINQCGAVDVFTFVSRSALIGLRRVQMNAHSPWRV